jgi:hypothetical protein
VSDTSDPAGSPAPDSVPPGPAPASGGTQPPPDSPPTGDGGPSKLLTGGGLLGALGFIALVIAIRGGKALVRKAVEEPATPPPAVKPGPGPGAASGLEHIFQRQQTLKTIEALRRQYRLSEEEMVDVLKAVWLDEHDGSGARPPWEPRATTPPTGSPPAALLGKKSEAQSARTTTAPVPKSNPDWWRYVDWDVDAIKDELLARQDKKKEPTPAKGK